MSKGSEKGISDENPLGAWGDTKEGTPELKNGGEKKKKNADHRTRKRSASP